jgi:hypothetical protein
LPYHLSAELDSAKLRDYCLSPTHPRGRHKARVFAAVSGLSAEDSIWLQNAILSNLLRSEANLQRSDEFGERWQVDILITRQTWHAVVRTIWIVDHALASARFITCWVL